MKNTRPRSPIFQSNLPYDTLQPYIAEDLLQKTTEWSGVNEIIRVSIKSLMETLKTQSIAIREIERNLSTRVTVSEFQTTLASKVNFTDIIELKCKNSSDLTEKFKNEIQVTVNTLSQSISNKCDKLEIEKLYQNIAKKADFDFVHEQMFLQKKQLNEITSNWALDVKNSSRTFENTISEKVIILHQNIIRLEHEIKELKKGNACNMTQQVEPKNYMTGFVKEIENWKSKIENKMEKIEMEIVKIDKTKPDKQDIRKALHEINQKLHSRLLSFKQDKCFVRPCETDSENEIKQCHRPRLAEKNPESHLNYSFSAKPKREKDSDLENIINELDLKVSTSDFNMFSSKVASKFEEVTKELLLKGSVKDICTLLDMKANIEDINIALGDIHKELDNKLSLCSSEGLNSSLSICGKWTFDITKITNTISIPWKVQFYNSGPDYFQREEMDSVISITQPGFYHLSFAAFSRDTIEVNIIINGELALIHKSKKYEKVSLGASISEFLPLNARTRLSVSILGNASNCEGFLYINKLI